MSSHMPMRSNVTFSIEGLIDTYDGLYMNKMKYISDSNQRWREQMLDENLSKYSHIHLQLHENTWSQYGFDIQVISLIESVEKFTQSFQRALDYNIMIKEGLKMREQRDVEFKKRYFEE